MASTPSLAGISPRPGPPRRPDVGPSACHPPTAVKPPPARTGISLCQLAPVAISPLVYNDSPGRLAPQSSKGVFMLEPQLPVRHEWLVRERDHAKLALEPFEPGFALAAGNAYRRVLLSSIHGSAPTWVKIENVLHEFS